MSLPRFESLQRLAPQHNRGALLPPNCLPDSINQLLLDLCNIVLSHDAQLRTVTHFSLPLQSDLTGHTKELHTLAMQTSSLLSLRSELYQTVTRVCGLEESHQEITAALSSQAKATSEGLSSLSAFLSSALTAGAPPPPVPSAGGGRDLADD
jgi:hypothetical protein